MQEHFHTISTYEPPTTQKIIKNYHLLSSQNQQQREYANRFLLTLADHDETWLTSQSMIQTSIDPNFVYLGAQLLYQKIQKDLHQLNTNFKLELKNFLFQELDSNKHENKAFILDKLSSSIALISCSLILNEWRNFLQDLTQFMNKSKHHLISGLIILQRIPQELKTTNRISQGIKTQIQNYFMQKEQLLSIIFNSVFQLQEKQSTERSLKTIESWIKVGFNLMKYQNLTNKVLETSLQSYQVLQIGIKVVCQALRSTSERYLTSLSGQRNPLKQQNQYSKDQINSLKIIILFVIQNKSNFFSYAKNQAEYLQLYLDVVKELLLNYNFLILQDVGFELLQIIYSVTEMKDLKLSQSTFEFWIDYSEKIPKLLITNQQVKNKLSIAFLRLFELMSSQQLMIDNEKMMFEADLKDDETVDENDGMSFSEYRKEVSSLLKYIYDFLVETKGEAGSDIYFKKISYLLETDIPPLTKQTQLAIFLLKSPLQSMINKYQTDRIIQILQYLLIKINQHNVILSHIPPIVLGQTMNFIRDCTREIKQKDSLFLESLKFVLNHINDEKLCHHAAYCFQILMETINTLNDPHIAQSLIQFYQHKQFSKQVVLQKMLEGIFNAIIKVPSQKNVEHYLDVVLSAMIKKYQESSKTLSYEQQTSSQLYLSLVEIKTVLDSFDASNQEFRLLYKSKFIQFSNKSLLIVNYILPLGIKNKLKFSSINEIGLCISIFRVCLKILQVPQKFWLTNMGEYSNVLSFIPPLEMILTILNDKDIAEYYYMLTILSETLVQFINHPNDQLNEWVFSRMQRINQFFVLYYQNIQKVDPDVVKMFFTVHQSLLLYNKQINYQKRNDKQLIEMSLYCLKHLNERNLQRKILGWLYLMCQNQRASSYQKQIISVTFACIPIINSICYTNLVKIYKQFIFKGYQLQIKQFMFLQLLNLPPYYDIDLNIKELLAKALGFALHTEQQRYIKSMFVQLNQIVWKKMSSDIVIQLELKLATWKRDYNKMLKEQKNQAQ